jgi:hypothetical protein
MSATAPPRHGARGCSRSERGERAAHAKAIPPAARFPCRPERRRGRARAAPPRCTPGPRNICLARCAGISVSFCDTSKPT